MADAHDKALSEPSAAREERLYSALWQAAPHVCSLLCPSVKKTAESWTHVPLCEEITAALYPPVKQPRHAPLSEPPAALAGVHKTAMDAAMLAVRRHSSSGVQRDSMEYAIRAYLAASPKPAALAEIEGLVKELRGPQNRVSFERWKALAHRAATALETLSARVGEALDWRDAMINKNRDLQEALNASIYNYGSITRERHDALARVAELEAALRLAGERFDQLSDAPDPWTRESCEKWSAQIDAALSTEAKAQGGER